MKYTIYSNLCKKKYDYEFNYTIGKRGWKGDIPQFQFDVGKIEKLGWTPSLSSDEAIRKTIQVLLSSNL